MGEAFAPQKTKQIEAGLKLDLDDFAHTFSLFEIKSQMDIKILSLISIHLAVSNVTVVLNGASTVPYLKTTH